MSERFVSLHSLRTNTEIPLVHDGIPYDRPPTAGRPADQWSGFRDAPVHARKGSLRYRGYVPELDLEVFDHLKVVDYGDAEIVDGDIRQSIDNVARKVQDVIEAG